jgi:hypothetical protein
MKKDYVEFEKLNLWRTLTLGFMTAGALGSLVLTIQAGRNNSSILLILLFVFWVLSPFIALSYTNLISRGWPVRHRIALYSIIIIITFSSLFAYSGVLIPPGMKKAAIFLIVPFLSWTLMIGAYLIIKFGNRK